MKHKTEDQAQRLHNKFDFNHMNRIFLITECSTIPFPPNCPKEIERCSSLTFNLFLPTKDSCHLRSTPFTIGGRTQCRRNKEIPHSISHIIVDKNVIARLLLLSTKIAYIRHHPTSPLKLVQG